MRADSVSARDRNDPTVTVADDAAVFRGTLHSGHS